MPRNHPIFDSPDYPWHRPDALELWKVLYAAIKTPNEINIWYNRLGGHLHPLPTPVPASEMWQHALENLAGATKVKDLCEAILADPSIAAIHPATRAVLNAYPDLETYLETLIEDSTKITIRYSALQGIAEIRRTHNDPAEAIFDDMFAPGVFSRQTGTGPGTPPTERKEYPDALSAYDDRDLKTRVVVLGDPGAGKSTTLRCLAVDLAKTALKDPSAPVPVLAETPVAGGRQAQGRLPVGRPE